MNNPCLNICVGQSKNKNERKTKMKRQEYHGYVIDKDNLGRIYIYDTRSPYTEDCDKVILGKNIPLKAIKEKIISLCIVKGYAK